MNENVLLTPVPGPSVPVSPVGVVKLSWAGLLGGMFVAVGVWLLLTVLGMAIGLSSFDPGDTMSTLKSVGIGAGIWSIVVSILALFAGGAVAARVSGVLDRPTGAIHGAVLWSLATLLSIVLVGGVVRGVVRGAMDTAGIAATAVTQTGQSATQMLGLDANTVIGPINERLRAEGKPTVTAGEMQAIMRTLPGTAVREGRLDKETVVIAVNQNTALSRNDARELADRIESQIETRASAAGQEVKRGAVDAAGTVGTAMWWVFLGMVLGLASAVLGSTVGVSRRQRLAAGVASPRLTTLREAHSHS